MLLYRVSPAQLENTLQLQWKDDIHNARPNDTELLMVEMRIEPYFLVNTLTCIAQQYRIDVTATDRERGVHRFLFLMRVENKDVNGTFRISRV
ncbi:hypothetical protein [Collimonas silvisoli]|uniref:hypothetical protein n=1 Tax=Collimonas silvisoli TaxID=2825884 RepID=UPI001B8CD823|nr:hypothetical protein [Collimonas silvisoli]